MGVYVKGMLMPKNCQNCFLQFGCDYALDQDGIFFKTFKPKECPVSEVVHCNECEYYQGVHGVKGHAPCDFWQCRGVMWNNYCSSCVKYQD